MTPPRDQLETPPRGLPRDGEPGSTSPHSSAALAARGPERLGIPGVPAPQPEHRQPHRPRRPFAPASWRPGLRSSRCRRRRERSRDVSRGCLPPCAPRTAPAPAPPAARQAVPARLPFGTAGPLFWTRGGAGSEREAALPARAAGRRARTAGLRAEGERSGAGKSCSEGRRRRGVGGGGGWGRR